VPPSFGGGGKFTRKNLHLSPSQTAEGYDPSPLIKKLRRGVEGGEGGEMIISGRGEKKLRDEGVSEDGVTSS